MANEYSVSPGTSTYGLGTYTDNDPLSVPLDARRVFDYLASVTPGFTQDRSAWDIVHFEGSDAPIIPGPIKSAVVAAALHGMCGVVVDEILERRDGKPKSGNTVTVNTDHAALWLGSAYIAYINGTDISSLARSGNLSGLFDKDFERGINTGLAGRATAIYRTKDPKVWYQLHGSLNGDAMLKSMGIDANASVTSRKEGYDFVQRHVENWTPDELEMHNVRHGLCGNICHSPQGWRESETGKALAKHPLVTYTWEDYAAPTPSIPLPRVSQDMRPLAGIKVLELVRIIAGPIIGATLASYGADVIRVNCSRLADLNMLQLTLNAGKRTIDLDINNTDDRARLDSLLQEADIFIQGFRYGSLDSKGLGLTDMLKLAAKRNKGIIYVDENCYGQFGPFATRPGWQQIADEASGISYVFGQSLGLEEGHSVSPSIPVADMTAGLAGALAAMMAIRDRASKGGSYHVFTSLVAANALALQPEIGLYPIEKVQEIAKRFDFTPSTADRYISDLSFEVVGRWQEVMPELLSEDSRFFTTFEDGAWRRQSILKPVVGLSYRETTPRWATPSVPNCYHPKDIKWL